MTEQVDISVRVNGSTERGSVPARITLADHLRDRLGLTGTRLGCEQGVCGACTVLVDGVSVRSCLMLAAQADGTEVRTVEGLSGKDRSLGELQRTFSDRDALQCGFCTPGLLMASMELLDEPRLDDAAVREALSGNLCRCTGYEGVVRAVLDVHGRVQGKGAAVTWNVAPGRRSVLCPEPTNGGGEPSQWAGDPLSSGRPAQGRRHRAVAGRFGQVRSWLARPPLPGVLAGFAAGALAALVWWAVGQQAARTRRR